MDIDVNEILSDLRQNNHTLKLKYTARNRTPYLSLNGTQIKDRNFSDLVGSISNRDLSFNIFNLGLDKLVSKFVESRRAARASEISLMEGKSLILDHRASEREPPFVYLEKENKIADISSSALSRSQSHLPREEQQVHPINIVHLQYNPYKTSGRFGTYDMDGIAIPNINLYNAPIYRKEVVDEVLLPESVEFILRSLADNHELTYEFLLDYISEVLRGRIAGFFLLVSTMEGTGKSSFAMIIKRLVGENNYMDLNNLFWDRQFNSDAQHKQFCYQDEVWIPEKKEANFKAVITEEKVAFEVKGKDIKLTSNTANYAGSSNHYNDCCIKGDARRFIIPNITNVKLKDRLKNINVHDVDTWMKEVFLEDINNSETLASMYRFFMERKIKHKVERIHTKSFYEGKRDNLRTQLRSCLDLLLSMDEDMDFKQFKSLLREEMKVNSNKNIEPIREMTLSKFLNDFQWRQIQPIGEIYKVKSTTPQGDEIFQTYIKSFVGVGTKFPTCKFDRDGIWDVEEINVIDDEQEFDFL